MSLASLLQVSQRQNPVVNSLANLLDQSRAVSAAIADNAQDEQISIPSALLTSFSNDLDVIKANLVQANQPK